MSLFEDTNPRELKELLGQIDHRETALPDFQRDFVWDPNATQELIVSIANNYPAGSLLRIRNTNEMFAAREFQGAPPLDGCRTTYLVLDGQQRLTSLYQAFFGVGDHRYFIDISKLLKGADFEEALFHLRANVKRAVSLQEFDTQAQYQILPLSVLKGGAGGFGRWSREVARTKKDDSERIKLEDTLSEIEEDWVRVIDDYRFPVVTLSDSTNAEAVCTIFETLNRTGVKLSPYELLTARFWPKEVNLRDLWAKAVEDFPIIEDFGIDPYYTLQIVALISPSTATCKRSDVLNLDPSDINNWWDSAVWGLSQALEMLRGDCGVFVPRWLPYATITIPLAATLGKLGLSGTPEVGANKEKLAQWFWCSVLSQAYDSAPNSQAAKDFAELVGWLDGGEERPETIKTFTFDPRILRDTTYRQRALYRGIICLVLRGGPRDFYSSHSLTPDLLVEHEVEDHHVFPYAYLGRNNVQARLRDSVLNRTLIDRDTNRRISDKAPSDYMEEIRHTFEDKGLEPSVFDDLLDSHHFPGGVDSPLLHDNFEAFLDWREEALWKEIRKVTGVRRAAHIVEEEGQSA